MNIENTRGIAAPWSPSHRGSFSGFALLVVLLGVLPGAAGCTGSKAARRGEAPRTQGELVVRRGALELRFLMTGELEAARSESIVVPRTPSWELRIRWLAADGASVVAGEKIVEFDNADFAGNLDEKRLAASQAENELARQEAETETTLADREYAVDDRRITREKAALKAEIPADILPGREYQENQLAVEKAKFEHDKAVEDHEAFRRSSAAELQVRRIALEKARREILAAERAIQELTLSSPRSGIFVIGDNPREGRKFQVGDTTWVGLTVARIPDLTEMRVHARLSDVDDGRIAVGMPAVSTLDTYPDRPFPGRVAEVSSVAQEMDFRSLRRAFKVTIVLDRSDPATMRPGMSTKVLVDGGKVEGRLLAPRAGLDLEAEPPRARLAGGKDVDVRLGACNALDCVIEGGLEEGARLRRRA